MLDGLEANSVCELLYKLRDAVAADNLSYALMMTREVRDRLINMIHNNESKGCNLNCEVTHETKTSKK